MSSFNIHYGLRLEDLQAFISEVLNSIEGYKNTSIDFDILIQGGHRIKFSIGEQPTKNSEGK